MKNDQSLFRHGIMNMKAYIPGKPVEEVQKEYGLTNIIKMASNENPLHTSPKALEAMRAELEKSYMYPEGSSPTVREALGKKLGIDPAQIICGNGGDQILCMIAESFVNEGEEVLTGLPSFADYDSVSEIMGGVMVKVALQNGQFDLPALLDAVTDKTKLIVVCNPNNPTGTIVRKAELEAFLKQVPKHVITVLDEAYFEYVDDPDYPNGIDYVKQGMNVIVVRTFSKLYGLAGNRIGYAITTPELMQGLVRVMPPFPVNRIAQAGAVAALADEAFLTEVKRVNSEGRAYLYKEFDRLGFDYYESHSNFIFVDVKTPVKTLFVELLKRGIIVRPATIWDCPTSLRITIGTMEENKTLVKALEELTGKEAEG